MAVLIGLVPVTTASDSITVTGKAIAAGVSMTIAGTGSVNAIIASTNSNGD